MKFIHYGSDSFDISRFEPVRNQPLLNKPKGGLWASPVDAEFGWKEWCEGENFELERLESFFEFSLSDDAKVIEISKEEDIDALPLYIEEIAEIMIRRFGDAFQFKPSFGDVFALKPIDFEKLIKDGVDAVLFNASADWLLRYGGFCGWDCDSLLVLNPEVVIPE